MVQKFISTAFLALVAFTTTGCISVYTLQNRIERAECNKDVFLLAVRIQKLLRERRLTHYQIADSLRRDEVNFQDIEITLDGPVLVYFTFSKSRDISKIKLTPEEQSNMYSRLWVEKEIRKPYDGLIRFNWPERFYNMMGFEIKK